MARSVATLVGTLVISAGSFAACSSSSDSSDSTNQGTDASDGGADSRATSEAGASPDGGAGLPDAAFHLITSTADLPLTGCPQAGYSASFAVGGPGSGYDLVIDTGSAELAIAGSDCSNCTGVSPLYEPSAGATNENATTSVSYVSGTGWSGDIFKDEFGPANGDNFASPRLVAIESQSGGFFSNDGCAFGSVPFSFQGIAGFGPSALAKAGTDEPMAALAAVGYPDIFATALCGAGGLLYLGYTGNPATAPVYTPMLANDYYAITVNGLSVAGTSLGLSATDIDDVVVDTDTTEFELPTAAYDAARDAIAESTSFQQYFGGASFFDNGSCIPANGGTTPTNDALDAALPTFTIQIDDGAGGSQSVTLNATSSYLEPIVKAGVTYFCPEIETRNSGGSTVLGSAFMREQVVVFDRASSRVGFAPYTGCTTR